jgi:hypothetical protein
MTAWWKTLGSPVLTPEVQKKLIDSVHAEAGSRTIEELEAERDEVLLGLIELRNKVAKSSQTKSTEVGRLRPGAIGEIDHTSDTSFNFSGFQAAAIRSLKCPPQPQQARPPRRSRCPYPTATSISWSTFSPRGESGRQEGADLHGDQGPADHQQVLVR